MDYAGLISLVLGGGLIGSIATFKWTRLKARAEAKASELETTQKAIEIWRETAEAVSAEMVKMRKENEELKLSMQKEIESLRKSVARLTNINNRIMKLLDKITPENLESMLEQIRKIHDES